MLAALAACWGFAGTAQAQTTVSIARAIEGNGTYTAGATLDVVVTFTRSGDDPVTQLGLEESLPAGWSFVAVVGGPAPDIQPSAGTEDTLNFGWVFAPQPPFNLIYRVQVPVGTTGPQTISGFAIYATDGPQENTATVNTNVPFGGSVGEGEGEGAPEGEGEGASEGEVETTVTLERVVENGGEYSPGGRLNITVTLSRTGSDPISQLGLSETLPPGWTFRRFVDGTIPPIAPAADTGGTLNFAYIIVPEFPVTFTYRVNVPAGASGPLQISGEGIYATDGPQEFTPVVVSPLVEGAPSEEGEEEEGEGETGEVDGLNLAMTAPAGFYVPGGVLEIQARLRYTDPSPITALGLEQYLPAGWTFNSLGSGNVPNFAPSPGASGTLEFAWVVIPSFPVTFTYRVNVPASATGLRTITGRGNFRTDGPQQLGNLAGVAVPQGVGDPEGEGEGSVEGEEGPFDLTFARVVPSGATYTPGGELEFEVTLAYGGSATLTALAVEERFPAGWTFRGISGGSAPNIVPALGDPGPFGFAWIIAPPFPTTFRYRAAAPADAAGDQVVSGNAVYREDGPELLSNVVATTLTPRPPTDLAVTVSSVTDPMWVGRPASVTFTVRNQGANPAIAPWEDCVYLAPPENLGAGVQSVCVPRVANLAPGASYTVSAPFTVPGVAPGDYLVLVDADAGDTAPASVAGDDVGVFGPVPVGVIDYDATVAAELVVLPDGARQLLLRGGAQALEGGAPRAGVPVAIDVIFRGTVRGLDVVTGADGAFETAFDLLPTEGGDYAIAARHPGLPEAEPEADIAFPGLWLSAPSAAPRLAAGVGTNVGVTLRNTGDLPVSGLSLSAPDAPPGLSVTGTLPASLAPGASAPVTLTLRAAGADVPGGEVTVRVANGGGAVATSRVAYTVRPSGVALQADASTVRPGAVRGGQTYFTFDVTNDGAAGAANFRVAPPATPWAHLVAPVAPRTLNPGQTQTVTLLFAPPANQPLGVIADSLQLLADGGVSSSVPMEINVVADATGGLRIRVLDEVTILAPGGAPVVGAEVRVVDPATGTVLASALTGAEGDAVLSGLDPGMVNVEARAPGHGVLRGVAVISTGAVRDLALFVPRQTVSRTWVSAPNGDGRLILDFEDEADAGLAPPVISIDPPVVDLRDFDAATTQRDFLVVNDGLSAAYNLELLFAEHPRFAFRPMVDVLGILPPGGAYLVPVLVEDLAFGSPGTASDCDVLAASGLRYATAAGAGNDQRFVPLALALPGALCPGALPAFGAPPLPESGGAIFTDRVAYGIGVVCPVASEPEGEPEGDPDGEGEAEGEPEGSAEGEPEGEMETTITLARAGVGGNTYTAGQTLDIQLSLTATGNKPLTSLGIREFLPAGWVFDAVVGGNPPQLGPTPGTTGELDFIWFVVPSLPFTVTYRVSVPPGQTGPRTVTGEALWSTDGPQFATGIVATVFSASAKDGALGALATVGGVKAEAELCARATLRARGTVIATGRTLVLDALVDAFGEPLAGVTNTLRLETLEGGNATSLFNVTQTGVVGLTGGGLGAGASAVFGWELTPTNAAAGDSARYYLLTGSVGYTLGGVPATLDLPGVVLTVLPRVEAVVDLYVPRQVFGDDPLAAIPAAEEPFTVGAVLRNAGGAALDTPTIRLFDPYFEDAAGNGVPVSLTGAQIGAAPATAQRLRANFPTISPDGRAQATWTLEPARNGAAAGVDFALTARMPDGFRAVVEPASVAEHDLVRMVRVDTPADDGLPDFLISDPTVPGSVPDTLHTSDGAVLPVGFAANVDVAFLGKALDRNFSLTATMPAGWGYVLSGIPVDTSYGLIAVRRADGGVVRPENVWLTRRNLRNAQDQPVVEERLHFIDFTQGGGARTYTLEFQRLPGFNTAPVANAGPDQTRLLEDTVFLSGEGSFDEDGDALAYTWTVASRPAGSAAQLQGANTVTPTFQPDRRGQYVFQLIVSDGIDNSAPDTVTVTIQNRPPVADAGTGFAVPLGTAATLNGAGSSDPDGDPLGYAWTFASRPAGSTTTIQGANTVSPSFVLDVPGLYVVQLVVNDGDLQSAPALVEIRTTNARPVANAGPAQSVPLGGTATLDGRASSDPDGDPLTFAWTFSSRPSGSQAVLQDANTAQPRFVADRAGSYLVQLIVSDGQLNSTPALVTVTTTNTRPVANAGPNRSGRVGDTVQLDGSASSDPDGDPLTYRWSVVSRPAGSTAGLSSETAVRPNFQIDQAGNYTFSLIVSDGQLDSVPASVSVSTLNTAPVANAGPDQRRRVGDVVTLDGGGSTDVDDNPLTFRWRLVSRPAGSSAALNNPQAVSTQFTIDQPGDYVAELIVNDGTVDSAPDTVTISTGNTAPRANAGPDRTVAVGAQVTLDGSASSDADNDELTYQWSFVSRPAGSAALLANPTTVNPRFTVDQSGDYVIRLVVNDGRLNSAPDTVTISTTNSAPVANAGANRSARVGDTVVLDGSASSDADNDELSFRWTLTVRPAGSAAALQQADTVTPRFTVDIAGEYVAQLIVNDGTVDSAPATVRVSTTNTPPVAVPGPNRSGQVGDRVVLNASASSDADNDPLSYRWSFSSRPEGSAAVIENQAGVITAFTIDVAGTYVVQLVVNDGKVDSAPATVRVSTENSPPVANAGADRTAQFGETVTLDGSGSTDPDGDPLTYAWTFTTRPAGSAAALAGANTVAPSFTIDVAGTYVAQLIVNDGAESSAPDRVTITTEIAPPVANPGSDQTRLVGQLAQLDGTGSFDPGGQPLTYAWTFVSRPQASSEALVGATTPRPSFRVDIGGTYVVQLIVGNGTFNSAPATVTISTENSRPVANAGPDQGVRVGARVQLDGTGSSDPDGDPLTYQWTLSTRPAGSAATLQSPTNARPSFTADVAGLYIAQLIVNDGRIASQPGSVRITADNTGPCDNPPAAPANVSATDGAFADRVAVTWSASAPGLQYRLWRGNSNDPAAAQPISGWINDLLYNDFSAPAPAVADAGGCACGGAPDVTFAVRHYFVEARSGPECVSALSQSDAGYRGAAVKALSEPGTEVAVAGLPSAAVDDLTRMAHPDSALHLRVRHVSEDLAEVWGEVAWTGGVEAATAWVPADATTARDGWLVFAPETPWPLGAAVTFRGGGQTVSGATLPEVEQRFEIWPEARALDADIEVRWLGAGALPTLFGGRGVAYEIAPGRAFDDPVAVMLPVPRDIAPTDAALFVYYHDETGPGWYRAEQVAGWIVPGSVRVVRSDGGDWLYLEARHGGVVQVGRAPGALEEAMVRLWPAGRAGDALVIAAVLLACAFARPRRGIRPASRG